GGAHVPRGGRPRRLSPVSRKSARNATGSLALPVASWTVRRNHCAPEARAKCPQRLGVYGLGPVVGEALGPAQTAHALEDLRLAVVPVQPQEARQAPPGVFVILAVGYIERRHFACVV